MLELNIQNELPQLNLNMIFVHCHSLSNSLLHKVINLQNILLFLFYVLNKIKHNIK